MLTLEPSQRLALEQPAVAVGNFDGVHRGHQALVAAASEAAARHGGAVAVLTFDPHPSRVLSPQRAPSTLMTLQQKAETLEGCGVDHVIVLPFTRELAALAAEDFVQRVLVDGLAARCIVVGETFRFGRERAGDLALLRREGVVRGFDVRGVEPVLHEGVAISSTRIREALARGGVHSAQAMLGRAYFVDGRVVEGDQRGRTLGIPTANVNPSGEILPAAGVYAGWCVVEDGTRWRAVINIGRRPTFEYGGDVVLEAHLLDFDGDLYGNGLRVEFEEHLRDERRFDGVDALKRQIHLDAERARVLGERTEVPATGVSKTT